MIVSRRADLPPTLLVQPVVQDDGAELKFRVCNLGGAAVDRRRRSAFRFGVIR